MPNQTFFSNSKALVNKQQTLFNKLWDLSIPLSLRKKELEFEKRDNVSKMVLTNREIQKEINETIEQTKKELILFSSNKILYKVLNNKGLIDNLSILLKKGVIIKILTDDIDSEIIQRINELNKNNLNNQINFRYTNKIGNIDELILIKDSKYLVEVEYDNRNNLVAYFSKKQNDILVKEILFEKYWNELNSLLVTSSK